jgi:hypothetical protein
MLRVQIKFAAGSAIAMPRTFQFGTSAFDGLFVHLETLWMVGELVELGRDPKNGCISLRRDI